MAAPANYVKIGLFVVLGLAAAALLAIGAGVQLSHKKTVRYFTYFSEPVTGIDVGSPVKARGVNVGHVGAVTFGPDGAMVEVRMDLDAATYDRFSGSAGVPGLRAQLASQGLTGARFVSIDYFDPKKSPPPALTFSPPARYIPATKSSMKGLEDSAASVVDGLATIVSTMVDEGLSDTTVRTVASANGLLQGLGRLVDHVDRQDLPQRASATAQELRVAADKVSKLLDHVDGDTGLIATTQRSISSFGEVGRNASGASRDLDETLAEIREAAAAIHRVADEIERAPDSLLKGRGKAASAP
jgi:ABC-type transporter Mla subunit MlaD